MQRTWGFQSIDQSVHKKLKVLIILLHITYTNDLINNDPIFTRFTRLHDLHDFKIIRLYIQMQQLNEQMKLAGPKTID